MQIQTKSLSPAKRDAFRKVLEHDGFLALIEVLESTAFYHEVEAANAAVGGTSGYDAKAKSEAEKAAQIQSVLEILTKMKNQPKDYDFTLHFAVPNAKP